jgi:hypothetical protein
MGASYNNTSVYIDGILVPSPFHGANVAQGATLSILTSETIGDIKLFPAAYPEKYGDSVGAALDLQTRDGSRTSPTFRATIGLADSELLGEGALGKARKGSWLASARKSYLGYLLRNRLHDTYDDISFYDGNLKLVYDVRPDQTVSFYAVGGHTLADRVHSSYKLLPNDYKRGTNDFVVARVGWRWALNPRLLLDTRAAYLQSPGYISNLLHQSLENDHHAEWVVGSSLVWSWRTDQVLEGGWMGRRVTDGRESTFYNLDDTVAGTNSQRGVGWKNDGYLQQASSFFGKRLHVIGSLRVDTAAQFDIHPVSPQVSASLKVASGTQLQFGVGRYNQFDFPSNLPGQYQGCPSGAEVLQTANHYTAGVEQRIGESARVKVLLFDRQNVGSVAFSSYDPVTKKCFQKAFFNLGRDYSRGAQIVLQGRSANRLSGWIGYTLTYARQGYPFTSNHGRLWTPYSPTLEDQRHTVNVFGSYRFSPTVHVSGKWLYGSGFPIPSENNRIRVGGYQRLDVRSEKDWAFKRWKLALYGEVLNVTNHDNRRYFYAAQNPDGTFTVVTGQALPVTPTAGVAFEF